MEDPEEGGVVGFFILLTTHIAAIQRTGCVRVSHAFFKTSDLTYRDYLKIVKSLKST